MKRVWPEAAAIVKGVITNFSWWALLLKILDDSTDQVWLMPELLQEIKCFIWLR